MNKYKGLYVKLTEDEHKMVVELRTAHAINISKLVKNAIRKEHHTRHDHIQKAR